MRDRCSRLESNRLKASRRLTTVSPKPSFLLLLSRGGGRGCGRGRRWRLLCQCYSRQNSKSAQPEPNLRPQLHLQHQPKQESMLGPPTTNQSSRRHDNSPEIPFLHAECPLGSQRCPGGHAGAAPAVALAPEDRSREAPPPDRLKQKTSSVWQPGCSSSTSCCCRASFCAIRYAEKLLLNPSTRAGALLAWVRTLACRTHTGHERLADSASWLAVLATKKHTATGVDSKFRRKQQLLKKDVKSPRREPSSCLAYGRECVWLKTHTAADYGPYSS